MEYENFMIKLPCRVTDFEHGSLPFLNRRLLPFMGLMIWGLILGNPPLEVHGTAVLTSSVCFTVQ